MICWSWQLFHCHKTLEGNARISHGIAKNNHLLSKYHTTDSLKEGGILLSQNPSYEQAAALEAQGWLQQAAGNGHRALPQKYPAHAWPDTETHDCI